MTTELIPSICAHVAALTDFRFCCSNVPFFLSGLDPSGYRQAMNRHDDEDDAMLGGAAILDDEERFKDAERLKFICPNTACKRENIIDCVFYGSVSIHCFPFSCK